MLYVWFWWAMKVWSSFESRILARDCPQMEFPFMTEGVFYETSFENVARKKSKAFCKHCTVYSSAEYTQNPDAGRFSHLKNRRR